MASPRRLAPMFLAALLAVILGVGPALAEDPPVDETSFAAGVEKAKRLLGRAKCKKGLELLQELVAEHGEKDYVLARRVELADLVRRLAFGAKHPAPKPKELVSGKLIRYIAQSGKIRIQYTPQTEDDLVEIGKGVLAFPARMMGPFTVTLEGDELPATLEQSPQVIVGYEEDPKSGDRRMWILVAGCPKQYGIDRVRWLPARLLHRDGGLTETIGEKDPTPAKEGKPYKLVVKMGTREVSGTVNGRKIGSGKKPPEIFGSVLFKGRNWTKLVIDGRVEPSWIQRKIDEVVQKNLAVFREDYDPADYVPAWLADAFAQEVTADEPEEATWPYDVDPAHYDVLEKAAKRIREGHVLMALLEIAKLEQKGVSPTALAFLQGLAHMRMFQLAPALEYADACLAKAPDFLAARLLRARILSRMGSSAAALAAFEAAWEAHPNSPSVYEQAVLHLLRAGQHDVAQKVFRQAAAKNVTSPDLDALGRALVKASSGPSWTRVYDYKSAHYHVFTDIDLATARKSAKILEEAHSAYQRTLKRVSRDGKKFKVYLFRGRDGFVTYMKDLGTLGGDVPVNVAGVYLSILKQLLIWNLPNRDMMLRTVRHEGLHQYLDRFLPSIPVWLNEGLAEYYEHGHRVAGRLYFGRVNRDHVRLLEKFPPLPMKEFLYLPPGGFYRNGVKSYAQAWAFMHMLREGDARWQSVFKKLFADLETQPPHQALDAAFGTTDWEKLDDEFAAYLEKLAGEE